jgi:hypothetical protein
MGVLAVFPLYYQRTGIVAEGPQEQQPQLRRSSRRCSIIPMFVVLATSTDGEDECSAIRLSINCMRSACMA